VRLGSLEYQDLLKNDTILEYMVRLSHLYIVFT